MTNKNQGTVVKEPTKKELLERLAKLEAMILSQQSKEIPAIEDTADPVYENEIRQDEYINVVSLCDMRLTLSTEGYGKGRLFSFAKFGDKKRLLYSDLARILYSDLATIIESHSKFLESGYFYILDPRVVRVHGLDDVYEKLMTKEQIEKVLGGGGDVVEIYKSANPRQQEVMQSILVNKLIENPDSLDLNFIDKISRISGVKLVEKAQESVEFANIRDDEEEDNKKKK